MARKQAGGEDHETDINSLYFTFQIDRTFRGKKQGAGRGEKILELELKNINP